MKPFTVFRVEALPVENLRRAAEKAQKNKIPVIIQASGPHDDYGRMTSRISLTELEQMMRDFSEVKGVYICEQAFRVFPERNRAMMDYAERLIRLAAEYGRIVFWADGHWGRNLWIDVGLNKKLMDTVQNHQEYFVPLWKMNGSLTPYSCHSALLGFWLGRAARNWGVQPERWYWYEAGFGKLNQQHWFKEGIMQDFPPSFYGQMILLGLSSGATIYSFEPSSDIWTDDGSLSEISRQVTFPLLSLIVEEKLIPRREEIQKKIQSIYISDAADSKWSLDYGILHDYYKTIYGLEHPFQIIPSTTRYFYLPVLSKWTSPQVLKSFPDQLRAGRLASAEEAKVYFSKKYAIFMSGNAWVMRMDNSVLIMNSRENLDLDQTFEVPMGGRIRKIAGSISVNCYLIIHDRRDEIHLHFNGRRGKELSLRLWMKEKPKHIEIKARQELGRSFWDEAGKFLLLDLPSGPESTNILITLKPADE